MQASLLEGLVHEGEVTLFEVAQAAVHQLRRPAGGAGREIALFDEDELTIDGVSGSIRRDEETIGKIGVRW